MPLHSRSVDEARDVLTVTWRLGRPADEVWSHLTDPRVLGEWLGTPLAFDGVVGAEIRVDHGQGYVCRSVITRVEPPDRLVEVSWQFPDEHETRVEVSVRPVPTGAGGGSSRLVLRHSGLAALRDSYAQGWVTHLTYLEASLDGEPLPPAQFWNLHATLGVLGAGR